MKKAIPIKALFLDIGGVLLTDGWDHHARRQALADPPADLPPHQSRQHSLPRLQGRGHDHNSLRHDGAERSGPLPSYDGVIDRLPQTGDKGIYLKQQLKDKLIEHKQYIDKYGEDLPEIRHWKWGATNPA
jgi:hypothetical protein